jgi:hypothetical protein
VALESAATYQVNVTACDPDGALVTGDEGGPIGLVFRVTGDSLDPVDLEGVSDDVCGDGE